MSEKNREREELHSLRAEVVRLRALLHEVRYGGNTQDWPAAKQSRWCSETDRALRSIGGSGG